PFSTRSWCRGLFAAGAVALGGHGAALRADQVGEAGRLAAGLLGLGQLPEQPGQHRGLAVVEILRRGEQRQRPPGRGDGTQPAERGPGQLAEVTLAEFTELGRVVPVPGTQLGGRRDVLGPVVQPERVLAQAARPDPVDEHAGPVLRRRLLVDAAHPDLGNGTHLCKSTQTVLPAAPSGSTPHWLAIASTAPSPCSGTARSVVPCS